MSTKTSKTTSTETRADLQTAQNRMFPFVCAACDDLKKEDRIGQLDQSPEMLTELFFQVRQQVLDLLNISGPGADGWHMGIADSGKRTIELLVNGLCPAEGGQNALVDTENYVGFNKFSAAKALEKQKGVPFEKPFDIPLGRALTVNAANDLGRLSEQFKANAFQTLWVAWNSTSTGIQEEVTEIVRCRNQAGSDTLIVADAASLRLFSNDWNQRSAEMLPDIFFFSLRKQGLPYDGPNDEFHQAQNSGSLIIFNQRALERSAALDAAPLYDSPTLAQYAQGRITEGEQRRNHILHLLKLNCSLEHFLSQDRKLIAELDQQRQAARARVAQAFNGNGAASAKDFSLFADPDAQSDSAFILKVPAHTSAKKVISGLKEKGVLVSACMHPSMDGQQYIRFAFYPGNAPEEIECLVEAIQSLT